MQGEFLWGRMFQDHLPPCQITPRKGAWNRHPMSFVPHNITGAAWWQNLAHRAEGLGQAAFSWQELKGRQ